MNIEVRYFSRGGNTKKLAGAIAKALGAEAQEYTAPLAQPTDLLFLGGSVYGFGLDERTKEYIAKLDAAYVKKVAVFGTSAIVKSGNKDMEKLLQAKGIKVVGAFHCWGAFTIMHAGRPNDKDLAMAANFAKTMATDS